MKAWTSSDFGKFATEYGPSLTSEFSFFSISYKRIGQLRPNFCIHTIIDKIYISNANHCFCKFATELRPLIDVRIAFCSIS